MPASLENIIVIYRLIYSAFTIMLHHLTTTGHIVPLISMYWSTSDSCWTPMNWPNLLSPNSNSFTGIICINFFLSDDAPVLPDSHIILFNQSVGILTHQTAGPWSSGGWIQKYWLSNDRILNISRAPDSWDPDEWGLICLNSERLTSAGAPSGLFRIWADFQWSEDWLKWRLIGRRAGLQNFKTWKFNIAEWWAD